MISCNNCGKQLTDNKGALQPYSKLINAASELHYYCIDDDNCIAAGNRDEELFEFTWVEDIEARDRSLITPDQLVWTKRNMCLVKNTSIGITFRIKRKQTTNHEPGLEPETYERYYIARADTKELLYSDLPADKLDYYLQVLSIDKVITGKQL